jgi:hypothetical protein
MFKMQKFIPAARYYMPKLPHITTLNTVQCELVTASGVKKMVEGMSNLVSLNISDCPFYTTVYFSKLALHAAEETGSAANSKWLHTGYPI